MFTAVSQYCAHMLYILLNGGPNAVAIQVRQAEEEYLFSVKT